MVARKTTPSRRTKRPSARPAALKGAPRYPNRINELARERDLTHDDLAAALGVNRTTIADRARGSVPMNQDWQRRLAELFQVPLREILERPQAEGLRNVAVTVSLQAGAWGEAHGFEEGQRDSVMVPDDAALKSLTLYGGLIVGDSMNKIYPNGSIVVLSRMAQRPNEILEGRRYHIRVTRAGGEVEETIKTLVRDGAGNYWMQPESDSPAYAAIPLDSGPDSTVELIGRVRYAIRRED